MRFFGVCVARRNIFVTSHDRSTDSHTCSDSQSLPRPTTIARSNITQPVRERQRPMSLRSAQQLVYCFDQHLFTPRCADPWNIIRQQDRVYKHAERWYNHVYYYIWLHSAMCTYWTFQILYIYTLQLDAYTVVPFLFAPLVIGHPDFTTTFSLQ